MSSSQNIKIKKFDSKFRRSFYTPIEKASFGGVESLALATKQNKNTTSKWLAQEETYTLHKPARRRYPRRRVIVSAIDQQWQADLVDVSSISKHNNNNKFLLTCIDVMSKFAWVVPLKDKKGSTITNAFERIFKNRRIPMTLHTDRGTEFYNKTLQTFLKKNGVKLYSTHNFDTKASVVERFNRTLKTKMWKYFTYKDTLKYTNVLTDLVTSYNKTVHSTIQMAPTDVKPKHHELLWQRLYEKDSVLRKPKFKVGDTVRVSKVKGTFRKGYLANWSEEIFVVDNVKRTTPPTYGLCDLYSERLEGSFYEEELQKVSKTDDLWKIEKVLKTRYRNKKKQVLVRWRGFPEKFDLWIDANQIKPV